jgi:hypothetical protein
MFETLKLTLTHFHDETLTLSFILLSCSLILFVLVWFQNRKKYHELAHQIPAGILKNYLDTVIENSHALKSSLLRGGGQGISPLTLDRPAPGSTDNQSHELLGIKNAEIAQLQGKLLEKDKVIKDLEEQLSKANQHQSASPTDPHTATQLQEAKSALEKMTEENKKITLESDDLKVRLKEYEIIEDDLANLKKLQTENEQLKKDIELLKNPGSLSAGDIPQAAAAVAAFAATSPVAEEVQASTPIQEDPSPPSPPMEETGVVAAEDMAPDTGMDEMMAALEEQKKSESQEPPAAAAEVPNPPDKNQEKTADELLGEFEKMLE